MELHAHPWACFYFVVQGRYGEICEKTEHQIEPSTLLFHPVGAAHSNEFLFPARVFHILPESHWFDHLEVRGTSLQTPIYVEGGGLVRMARRIHKEYLNPDPLAPLILHALALELLVHTAREYSTAEEQNGRSPAWLSRIKELLHDRYMENLSLEEIAGIAGVHPSHLARAFRQHTRSSIGEYQRKLRMEKACRELSTTDQPLIEIALALGYSDQSHFSTAFKRELGISPLRYRKSHLGG